MKYINAHETKNELSHFFLCEKEEGESVTLEEIEQVIDRMESADVVEVVRCEDCKFYLESKYWSDVGRWCHKFAEGINMPPDGYCSNGKRRETE